MNNFEFANPTKLIFGKGSISKLAVQLPKEKKIMITFGGGSVKRNGVYDQVIAALEGFDYIEFWGIEPNPLVDTVREAAKKAKEEGVEYLLAVGGGSTLDATKVIAVAACSDKDAWDLVLESEYSGPALPMASVLTLPATGSEMNRAGVISNGELKEKFALFSYFPQFSILDPQVTFSLPAHQISCGLADTFVHVMEQYITQINQSPLMDRWAEGIMLTIKESAPKIMSEERDYDSMANFMLSATMALNGFIGMGVAQDWATHKIGHELTALTGLTHGHTLTIILPALLKVMSQQKWDKILQFGQRIFDITEGSEAQRVEATIDATENFFRSLGLKTRLGECGVSDEISTEIVRRLKERGSKFGEKANITHSEVAKILELCR